MQLAPSLSKKISQAVQTSMQIEGYKTSQSPVIKKRVKALMERRCVKVSTPRK